MKTHALASTTLTCSPSVSGHFTHCWAFRSVLRVVNSIVVAVPIYSIFDLYATDFLVEIHTAKTGVLRCCLYTHRLLQRTAVSCNDPIATK